jgi:hypothetical protein
MSKFSERVRSQKTGLFKVADFAGGREEVFTVDRLEEDVEMFEQVLDILYFVETKQGLKLNQTNSEFLLNALGDDPEKWKGQHVVLYLTTYTYGEESGHTIRIKLRGEPQPAASKPAPKPAPSSGARAAFGTPHNETTTSGDGGKPPFNDEVPF